MSDADGSTTCCSSFGKWPMTGLLVVVLIAAATRLIGLGSLDVWGDEVYSHDASSELLPKLLKWETPSNESSSPWPFLEIKIARQVFGESSFLSIRVPSAVHGIIAVAAFYLLIGFAVNWRIAFAAALLLAINPFCLEWSREGRMYQQWLVAAIALMAVMHSAVEHARLTDPSPLNWRWWLIGMLFMLVHAANVMGAMTIIGAGLWLGLMAQVELVRRPSVGVKMLLGAALASAVYLGSWGLTGIAKILMLMQSHGTPSPDFKPAVAADELIKFAVYLAGHVPLWAAAVIWLVALAGLGVLAAKGHARFALLVLFVGLAAWIGFPSIAKRHFFDPRYVFTGLLALTLGLGAAFAYLWEGAIIRQRLVARAIVIVLFAGMVGLSAPYLYEVFFVPKMEVRKALAPIQQHAADGEVFMLFPDYYVSFNGYKPYHFGDKVKVIRGPKDTGRDASIDAFKDTFENVYHPPTAPAATDGEAKPKAIPAAWLFLLRPEEPIDPMRNWDNRFKEIEPVLAAYGLSASDIAAHVDGTTYTLTLRLSRDEQGKGKIDHVVQTRGRRFR